MPINKNIVGREITHEELQSDLFPDFGNDTISKEDTSHTITTPPRETATGAGIKTFVFRNQNYLNSGSALDVKTAGEFLFLDISESSTLSDKSTSDELTITNGVIDFEANKIYDIKVKLKLEPEVSNNHLEIALAKDTLNVYDSSTITTSKLVDARYEAEFSGFVYDTGMGDVKLFVSNCVTGGSALNIHTIKIVIKEIGQKV